MKMVMLSSFVGRVNIENNTVLLQWFDIAVSTAVIIVVAIIIAQIVISHQKYVCPKCGAVISPKWYHLSAGLHIGSDRVVKCPCCGRKGFCKKV